MKKNRKVFHIRRQTASAMAVVLAVLSPGMFPAGLAMAESVGTLAPVMQMGMPWQRRVTQRGICRISMRKIWMKWNWRQI